MNYEEQYKEEVKLFNSIYNGFNNIQENDVVGAYRLMLDSFQAYNRWSKIKCDIKKELGRGEKAAIKERLGEMCKYLYDVGVTSRNIWKSAKEDLRIKEDY